MICTGRHRYSRKMTTRLSLLDAAQVWPAKQRTSFRILYPRCARIQLGERPASGCHGHQTQSTYSCRRSDIAEQGTELTVQ